MARSLKVPLFMQPAGKPYCGPTSIRMLLSFYGVGVSLKSLVNLLPMTSDGIDLYSMGIFLKSFGDVALFIDENSKNGKEPIYKYTIPMFKGMEGLFISSAIRTSDIRKSLAMGYPVILNIESLHRPGRGHYVVVKNIGKKRITINDPSYGQRILSIKRIMKSCHGWSGGAIILFPSLPT